MTKRRSPPPSLQRITADEILRADPRALSLLAASDHETWNLLGPCSSEPIPPVLLRALFEIGDPQSWLEKIDDAYAGLSPDAGGCGAAMWSFRPRLASSIARGLSPTDLRTCEALYFGVKHYIEDDAVARTRALATDLEKAGISDALLGGVLLVLAIRAGEEGDHDSVIAAAHQAETVFSELGDVDHRGQAVRLQGAALLRLGKIDDALAILEPVMEIARTPMLHTEFSQRDGRPGGQAVDVVLDSAASLALHATTKTPSWILALGAIADRFGHAGCAARFAAGKQILDDARANVPDDNPWAHYARDNNRIV